MVSVGIRFKFNELCEVFERISSTKNTQDKGALLSTFIKSCKEKVAELATCEPELKVSIFPVLRLIVPQLERARSPYGIKELTFTKLIVKVLALPPTSPQALRLAQNRESNTRDFADVAYLVLRDRYSVTKNLSIADINSYLDSLAEKHGKNDARGVEADIFRLLQSTSAEEQKWFIRIVLKDLRLGLGNDHILRLFHPDAADFYGINNDLSKVCEVLSDTSVRLHEIEISIFSPFRPMLSQRCDITQFHRTVTNNVTYYIETKFDGERFQLHMDDGVFKYFSRNGYDYTETYGSTFTEGLFTPSLKIAFKSSIKKIILDGEMMGWNKTTKKFGSKGMNFDVKHLKLSSTHQPCFCVFDILLYNEAVLVSKPLKDRLKLLKELVTPIEGVIMISKHIKGTTKQNIIDALNESMDKDEEGIVFKDPSSLYKPNDRKGGWWKMKLEYFENVMSDLDVIILGGYYGDGKHRSEITGFLVGVSIPPEEGQIPVGYLSFAKIASGLNNKELKIIQEKLGPHWKRFGDGHPDIYGIKYGKERPNVWIAPEHSCVLLVRGSELIKIFDNDFTTNYTLRFPRIKEIRLDKKYYECLTVPELAQLTESSKSVEKLMKRHIELSDLEQVTKKRKKKYFASPIIQVTAKSTLLQGHEFFVLTGTEEWQKADVELAICEFGGSIVRSEGVKTFCILVGDNHIRADLLRNSNGLHDLVKLNWLKTVIETENFKMYEPHDLIYASPKTREIFLQLYDKYGDSFINVATIESLQNVMDIIEKSGDFINLTGIEQKNFEDEIQFTNNFNVFDEDVAYFDKYKIVNDSTSKVILSCAIEERRFKFFGGQISSTLNKSVTIIITNDSDPERLELLNFYLKTNNFDAKILSKKIISSQIYTR